MHRDTGGKAGVPHPGIRRKALPQGLMRPRTASFTSLKTLSIRKSLQQNTGFPPPPRAEWLKGPRRLAKVLYSREAGHMGGVVRVTAETAVMVCVPGKCSHSHRGSGRKRAWEVHSEFLDAPGPVGRGPA